MSEVWFAIQNNLSDSFEPTGVCEMEWCFEDEHTAHKLSELCSLHYCVKPTQIKVYRNSAPKYFSGLKPCGPWNDWTVCKYQAEIPGNTQSIAVEIIKLSSNIDCVVIVSLLPV